MARNEQDDETEPGELHADHVDEFYLSLIRQIIDVQKAFIGEKNALKQARRAPLHIDKDGRVSAYYGEGKYVIDILTAQFEQLLGETVARTKIKEVVRQTVPHEAMDRIPERVRIGEQTSEKTSPLEAFAGRIRRAVRRWM